MRPLPLATLVLFPALPSAAGLPRDPLAPEPPYADFVWSPYAPSANEEITFVSTSSDPDGLVIVSRWYLPGDDALELRLRSEHTASFPVFGVYNVTLEVTDDSLQVSRVTRSVFVRNLPPVLDIAIEPSPAYRGAPVSFVGLAEDPDGDAIVNWTWDLGDGTLAFGAETGHTYASLGTFNVTLSAMDEAGNQAFVARMLRVLNQPPRVVGDYSPRPPRVNELVHFVAEGIDPDLAGGPVTFTWDFSDGLHLEGASVERTFASSGNESVVLRGRDSESAASSPQVLVIQVQPVNGP